MILPTSTCGKLLISAVTHGDVHLFRYHPDHFAGPSLMVCPFADHLSLLSCQSRQSLTFLTALTEKRLSAANKQTKKQINEYKKRQFIGPLLISPPGKFWYWPVHPCNSSSLEWLRVCARTCMQCTRVCTKKYLHRDLSP